MNYSADIAKELVHEIMQILYKYQGSVLAVTVLGCLEAAKLQLMAEQFDAIHRRENDE
jgi:hypothetical protein